MIQISNHVLKITTFWKRVNVKSRFPKISIYFYKIPVVGRLNQLYLQSQFEYPCGGIGRRARLRGVCPRTCGFDSHRGYKKYRVNVKERERWTFTLIFFQNF